MKDQAKEKKLEIVSDSPAIDKIEELDAVLFENHQLRLQLAEQERAKLATAFEAFQKTLGEKYQLTTEDRVDLASRQITRQPKRG